MDHKDNIRCYFLEQDFGEVRTGVENSALLRARIFRDHLSITPILLTVTYYTGLNFQRKLLYEKELLDSECKIVNMYEYFQETKSFDHEGTVNSAERNPDWIYKPVPDTNDYRVYDSSNNQIMYQSFDSNGLLLYSNVYVNKKRVRRDSYDSWGFLSRSRLFDIKTGQISSEAYYRIDGSICIYKHYEFENDKNEVKGIHIFDRDGKMKAVLSSDTELIAYWLLQLLDKDFHNILIIDKERIYFPAVMKINRPDIYKVCMIHNLHVQKDQDIIKGKLKNDYKEIFENIKAPDGIVLLTVKQKKHIVERYGPHENLFVIPHSLGKKYAQVEFDKRMPRTAICLARYFDEKQHDKLIRSFKTVTVKYPDATLNLYGFGEPEQVNAIKRQVVELGLEKNVYVNDFVNDVERIYDSASLSVLASRMEGFSLFLLESITHGCPIVSYDVNYGASDMVDDGINGYITEMNNEEQMAERIIELFGNPEKLRSMSEASYKKSVEFGAPEVAAKWLSLIETILDRRNV